MFLIIAFSLTEKNELCAEKTAVDTLEKCGDAVYYIRSEVPNAKQPINIASSINRPRLPKGCFLHVPTNQVYFNKHSTGSSDKDSRQICEKTAGRK